eukprot:Pgem_evm1s19951
MTKKAIRRQKRIEANKDFDNIYTKSKIISNFNSDINNNTGVKDKSNIKSIDSKSNNWTTINEINTDRKKNKNNIKNKGKKGRKKNKQSLTFEEEISDSDCICVDNEELEDITDKKCNNKELDEFDVCIVGAGPHALTVLSAIHNSGSIINETKHRTQRF